MHIVCIFLFYLTKKLVYIHDHLYVTNTRLKFQVLSYAHHAYLMQSIDMEVKHKYENLRKLDDH